MRSSHETKPASSQRNCKASSQCIRVGKAIKNFDEQSNMPNTSTTRLTGIASRQCMLDIDSLRLDSEEIAQLVGELLAELGEVHFVLGEAKLHRNGCRLIVGC